MLSSSTHSPSGFFFAESLETTKTWELGDLPRDTGTTKSYNVLIDSTVQAGTYRNLAQATISNGSPPNNRDEDSAQVEIRTTTIGGNARLEIGKVASVEFTNPDTVIRYTITVQNVGAETAWNVAVDDVLPDGFTFVDSNTDTKTFPIGNLGSGVTETFFYNVKVGTNVTTGNYENAATADADNTLPVTATDIVEVRKPQVKGITTLPETGINDTTPLTFSITALTLITAGTILARKREEEQNRIYINFVT